MADFFVQVKQSFGTEKWQNRWRVTAADIDTVAGVVGAFVDFHKAILSPGCNLDEVLISTTTMHDGVFIVENINEAGTLSPVGQLWPRFNTIRMDLNTAAHGRPGRKYFRGALGDENTVGDTVDGSLQTAVADAADTLLAALTAASIDLAEGPGTVVTSFTVHPLVQMRQEHRKRRRPAGP